MRKSHTPAERAGTRLPPLNPLRAFEAAGRSLSVAAAASDLHVTPSAISHQIRVLEGFLGVALFDREGGRLKLTAHGALLLPAASHAFQTIAGAVARVRNPTTQGDLVVSCVPGFLFFWLVPSLRSFTAQFPDIRLRLVPSNDPRDVYAPRYDINIRYSDGHFPDLSSRKLSGLDLFPVGSPSLLTEVPLRSVRDLAHHVLLHADEGREWTSWLNAWEGQDMTRGRHHFYTDAHLALEAATHGNGIALGDSITTSRLLAGGRLVAPLDLSVTATQSFYVVLRPEVRSTALVQAFTDWLYEAIERDAHRGDMARTRQHR